MTNTLRSLAWPIDKAIVTAITADVGIGGLFDPALAAPMLNASNPVWSNVVPAGAALDYLVLGDSSDVESAGTTFGGWGRDNGVTVHVWTRDTSKRTALLILARLTTLLHRRALDCYDDAGGLIAIVAGPFAIVTVLADPGGDVAHGVGRLDIESYQSAGA